jgi:hypothetical protein
MAHMGGKVGSMIAWMGVVWTVAAQVAMAGQSLAAQERAIPQEAKADPQLEVNREALLRGSTEHFRIAAASLLLASPDPAARKILLDCLGQSDVLVAQAVCKALGQTRTDANLPLNLDDFIQPLLRLFEGQDQPTAKLAAEAALVFRYDKIGKAIEQLANDRAKPLSTRLNAIYALRLQPDMSAAITLVALVDDDQVKVQATEALHAIGIPAGKDPVDRSTTINELKHKNKEEFLRDWVVSQEDRVRKEREQTEAWKRLSLQVLDKLYGTLPDDPERARFLADQLKSQQSELKLWALDKLKEWRVAGRPVPQEVWPTLASLIGDGDKSVRLAAAQLLAMMAQVCPPEKFLAQLAVEQDEDVKAQLFPALGKACDYALSSDSGVQMAPDAKMKTLQLADDYLSSQDPNRARSAAVVMGRLLEKGGLASRDMDRYLGQLDQRFRRAGVADATLRSDLVGVMASLCSAQSACKDLAQKRFEAVFEVARSDENDRVREQAVEGFVSIDKASALKKLRQGGMGDKSPKIRKRLIDLATEVGVAKDDLDWLAGRIGPNSPDSEAAWQAMSAIWSRSETEVLRVWLGRLKTPDLKSRLSADQWRAFLALADRKTGDDTDLRRQVLEDLAVLHDQKGDLDAVAGCLQRLIEVAKDPQKDLLVGRLLGVFLRQSKVDQAAGLLQAVLDKRDLIADEPMAKATDDYMQAGDRQDRSKVLDAVVKKVSTKEPRPGWDQLRQRWLGRPAERAGEPNQASQVAG